MKGKAKKILIVITILLSSTNVLGQLSYIFNDNHHIDSNDIKKMYLEINAVNFFKNNEFKGEKVKGYTLPGFRLSTNISLAMSKKIKLEMGINFLRYWGSEAYPCYSYLSISEWESERYNKGLHFIPIMRGQFAITDSFHIIIGTLYNHNNHFLCRPLYNNELNYTADPENGVQIIYSNKYYTSDIWLNWQSFIFKNDIHQELFTFGYTSTTNILRNSDGLNLSIPLQFLAQHRGGEINNSEKIEVQTASNYATGLNTLYNFNFKYLKHISLSCNYVGFMQNTGTLYPFDNGWGVYSELSVKIQDFKISTSYWISEDFITMLGSPHFGNQSQSKPKMTFDKMDMFMIDLEYCYHKNRYFSFGLEGNYIHYFPYTGTTTDNWPMERGSADSFAFGLFLKINPRIKILNVATRIDN